MLVPRMHIPSLKILQPGGGRSVLIVLQSITSPLTRAAANPLVRFPRTPRVVTTVVGKQVCRVLVLVLVLMARAGTTTPSSSTNSNIYVSFTFVYRIRTISTPTLCLSYLLVDPLRSSRDETHLVWNSLWLRHISRWGAVCHGWASSGSGCPTVTLQKQVSVLFSSVRALARLRIHFD